MTLLTGLLIPVIRKMSNRTHGFTLIEILLVTVIIAVTAGLAVPHFSRMYAGVELRKAADDLAYRMRYAQSCAITKNTLMRLEFDPLFTQYRLTRQSGDEAAGDAFVKLPGRLGERITIARGIQVSFKDEDSSFYFYPDGTMDKRRINLCRGEECVFVSTQQQRGQVLVLTQSLSDFE